jgi:tRNA-dihydrouridine synthase C
MAETARRGVEAGAIGVDLNFGCPVARVNQHDGGAALLRDPDRITRVIRAVCDAIPTSVPVSAKLRMGWSSAEEAPFLAEAVEQGGACMLTMHARTRLQQYSGTADWSAIARARERVSIPVVANGDIRIPQDIVRCSEQTGCNRFMIGRGALMRPELFRLLSGLQKTPWSPSQRVRWLCSYGDLCLSSGMFEKSVVGRVKGVLRYMAEASDAVEIAFRAECRHERWAALRDGLLRRTEGAVLAETFANVPS